MAKTAKKKTAKPKAVKDPAVVVIASKDAFLATNTLHDLLDEVMPEDQRALGLFQPDLKESDIPISEVLDELRTRPFLADKKVVVLKDADSFISAHRPSLERYFDAPSDCGLLILVVSTWLKTTKLAKKLPSIGKLIMLNEIKPQDLPAFVSQYAQDRHDKKIPANALHLLIEKIGDQPGRLCMEIDKLALYAGTNKTISLETVKKLSGSSRQFDAFGVIDSITSGNTAEAMERLRNMFRMDRSAGYTAVGAFAYHFRRMFQARAILDEGVPRGVVEKKLRIWHNKQGFFAQLSKLSLRNLGTILARLARIDHQIKTGQTTADISLEKLLLALSQKR